jgi:hypothetical protein
LTDGERLISFVCISIINGYIEIVKLLLERDADIQCDEARWRETPKQLSLRGGKHEIVDPEEQTRKPRKVRRYPFMT